MKNDGRIDPVIANQAALLAIGELLDELICHLRGFPIDEKHLNFGSKLLKHLEGLRKDAESNQG